MPKLDGYEACRRIRADAIGAHIPILMVTGLEDVDSIDRAYSAGATDFISKPINWSLLSHRVRYVLRASTTYKGVENQRSKKQCIVERYAGYAICYPT